MMRRLSILAMALVCAACTGAGSESTSQLDAKSVAGNPPPVLPIPPTPNGDGLERLSDIDFTSYSLDLASFLNLNEGESKSSVEDKVHAAFKPNRTPEGEGHTEYSLTELKAEGGSVMVATAEGFADDSVKAQQLYVIFKDEKVVTYGLKVKCWRSKTSDKWQKTLCP